jgi:hypothetical protein
MPKARSITVAPLTPTVAPVAEFAGPFKPGYDPRRAKGREGARNKFATEFFADFYETWLEYGKAALETTATLYPNEYVRAAAGLMPREMHATIANVHMERMTTFELRTLIDSESRRDLAAQDQGADLVQDVGA